MPDLAPFTTLANLLALASSLWLGFYILTRSPTNLLSWLAALTLWALAGYFLNNAIAINLPGSGVLTWLRQTVILVLPLWFHLTTRLQPPRAAPDPHPAHWTASIMRAVNRYGVPVVYLIAAALVAVGLLTRDLLSHIETAPATQTNSRDPGPAYILFVSFLGLVFILILLNLWRGKAETADPVLRGRFNSYLFASTLAGLGGLYLSVGTLVRQPWPTFPGDLLMGAGVGLIQRGFIAVRQDDQFVIQAAYPAPLNPVAGGASIGQAFALSTLAENEMVGLVLPARKGLQDMELLIPLHVQTTQVGALVLGARIDAGDYAEADLELLEDLGDQMASVIHGVAAQEDNARQINELVEDFRNRERELQLRVQQMLAERAAPPPAPAPTAEALDEQELTPLVEDALRQLHDYPYLGEHRLAQLRVVQARAAARSANSPLTFLDQGKAVSETLIAVLEELRPDAPPPKSSQIPPCEWHLYYILHDSYVEGQPNRDIMSKLYIGEGTFNRARRRALRAVAKSLAELEHRAGA